MLLASLENQSENHMSSITPATTPPTIEEETAPGNINKKDKFGKLQHFLSQFEIIGKLFFMND